MDRIKGVEVAIYSEDYSTAYRTYQDPEGWAISDAGLNEDEKGYYFSVQARGYNGEVRNIAFKFTQEALAEMFNKVDERWPEVLTFEPEDAGDSCTCDGCVCQPEVYV